MSLLRFDGELRAETIAGEPPPGARPEATLAEALAIADPTALLAAAREALAGAETTVLCPARGRGELTVRVGPDPARPGSGLALCLPGGGPPAGEAERRRAEELDMIASAARELARSTDADEARSTICEAALGVCGGDLVLLFEPDTELGALQATTVAGAEVDLPGLPSLPLNENWSAMIALRTNTPRFVADPAAEASAPGELIAATGMRSALWQPIARGRSVRALLMIAWHRALRSLQPQPARLLEVISVEAAVALDRGSAFSRLVAMARSDPLTGLPNRRAWQETLGRELARSGREGAPLSVAMIDLDRFKAYNDSRGHSAGDRLLERVAQGWLPLIRTSDTLARYGGDEFALLLPHCELQRAAELLGRLEELPDSSIGFCAGAVSWDGAESAEALIDRADRALYRAKAAGAGTVIAAEQD